MSMTNFTGPRASGHAVPLLPFRPGVAAVGVAPLSVIMSVLPDPALEEAAMTARSRLADAYRGQRAVRDHAALRAEVQRFLKGSAKGRNVGSYANYIAAGLRGDHGEAWSIPPLTLWSPRSLTFDNGSGYLPLGGKLVAMDAETQVAAWHRINNDPEGYDLDPDVLDEVLIPFEIYWGIPVTAARQIFRDRNLLGVAMPKNLALAADSRDLGTIIAREAARLVKATDPEGRRFAELIEERKRQIGGKDKEWVTLSAWRGLAVTMVLGTPGIEATSRSLEADALPEGVDLADARAEAASLMAEIVDAFPKEFAGRTAITAPAVLAGIGALAHLTMPWYKPEEGDPAPMTKGELLQVLRSVRWAREPQFWEGVAAKRATTREGELGALSFAGGIKDSAHRVYLALLSPDSELGKRIRGNA
jgi:hypothetical protein